MSSEWKMTSFKDAPFEIIDGDRGVNYPKKNEFYPSGHCLFLNAGNVTKDGFSFAERSFINAEKDSVLRKGKLTRHDLVLTTRGTVGNVGYYGDDVKYQNIRINSGMVIIRPDVSQILPYYLYLFLRSRVFREQMSHLTSGSAQPQLPIRDLNRVELCLPPIQEQQFISNVLGVLDDRITLLRETNKTLESIAQAIFKSWFVDFDPVRAKMEGRQPEGMDEDTAALFPDSFEESELGLVPRGWKIRKFLETVDVIGGGTPKTSNPDYWNGGIPWFSVVDAPELSDVWVVRTEKKISEKGLNESSTKLLPVGTTIISARGTVGKLALTGREMAMNQSCYGLRGKYDDVFFTYFSTKRLVDSLRQHSHGSVFDTITKDTLSRVKVVLPAIACLEKFEQAVDLVMKQMLAQSERGYCISQIRDTLLPRLISGQLRLPETDTLVEETAV